jgi:prefoldin subunit 5
MSDDRPRCEHLFVYPMDNCTACMKAEIERLRESLKEIAGELETAAKIHAELRRELEELNPPGKKILDK